MNTVSISFSKSKIFVGYDAIAVRCGYILGDQVLFAGDVHLGIYAQHYFDVKHETVKDRFLFLIENVKKKPQEGLTVESLQKGLADWQLVNNRKHKSKDDIIFLKKIGKAVSGLYTQIASEFLGAFEHAGISELGHLIDEGIKLAVIFDEDREIEHEKNTNGRVKLSTVLADRFNTNNPNDIYLVTAEFSDFLKETKTDSGSLTGAVGPANEVLSAPLFKLPAIAQLKATELQSIHKNVYGANEIFSKNMNQWSQTLKAVDFDGMAFGAMQQYFKAKIQPTLEPVQNAIDADERIILSHRANNQTFELSVALHVCSVALYWRYLTWANLLGLETMNVLNALPGHPQNLQTTCLLLQCSMKNVEQQKEKETQEQPVLTKRKTLDID